MASFDVVAESINIQLILPMGPIQYGLRTCLASAICLKYGNARRQVLYVWLINARSLSARSSSAIHQPRTGRATLITRRVREVRQRGADAIRTGPRPSIQPVDVVTPSARTHLASCRTSLLSACERIRWRQFERHSTQHS